MSHYLSNGINAAINCPLKKSTIAWVRCEEYRKEHNCLCKEARERLRIKGQGREALEDKLRRLRKPTPERLEGWTVERRTRFYLIENDNGELVHRATNQREAEDYLNLVAKLKHLEQENKSLWAILTDELVEDEKEPERIEIVYDEDLFDDAL